MDLYFEVLKRAMIEKTKAEQYKALADTYCDFFPMNGANKVLKAYKLDTAASTNNVAWKEIAKKDMDQYMALMLDLYGRLLFEKEAYL